MNQKGLILYICHSSTMKMIFIKKANILQLLVLLIVLSSCTKEKKKIE
ncbi:MAG: hypothetical protein RL619_2227, partial [Bacteroidota bacterium]